MCLLQPSTTPRSGDKCTNVWRQDEVQQIKAEEEREAAAEQSAAAAASNAALLRAAHLQRLAVLPQVNGPGRPPVAELADIEISRFLTIPYLRVLNRTIKSYCNPILRKFFAPRGCLKSWRKCQDCEQQSQANDAGIEMATCRGHRRRRILCNIRSCHDCCSCCRLLLLPGRQPTISSQQPPQVQW